MLHEDKIINPLMNDKKVKGYLKKIKDFDKNTYEHCVRLSILSMYLAYKNSFSQEEIKMLGYAGLLHDIGKLDIPIQILHRKRKLTDEEKKIVQEHPRLSFLRLNDPEFQEIRKIIVAHHEFQTKSYPRTNNDRRQEQRLNIERRKENGKIKKLAEILSICDMYDALASKRCYKKPLNKEEIEERIRKQFTGQKKYIKQILNVPKDLSRC